MFIRSHSLMRRLTTISDFRFYPYSESWCYPWIFFWIMHLLVLCFWSHMFWKWMSLNDVNPVKQYEYINVGKSNLDWHRWERNLKHLKKQKEDGNIHLIHWLSNLRRQFSLPPSVSLPFPFLLLLGSNFKQYDFLHSCHFKGNKPPKVSEFKGVFFPKREIEPHENRIYLQPVNAPKKP